MAKLEPGAAESLLPRAGIVTNEVTSARNFNLDVLRGIAILIVVLFHMSVPVFRNAGWIGVDLFFVLSGFLISGLLFREWITTGSLNIPRFYVRRAFKIYPAFYVMLLITLVVNVIWPGIPSYPVTWHSTLAEATFTQNYFQGIWGQTWSLAVEEHFYLLLPLGLWLLQRRKKRDPFSSMPTLFLMVVTGELALRFTTTWQMATAADRPYYLYPTHLRLDGLMFGVLLSYLYHFKPEKFAEYAKGNVGLVITGLGALMALVVASVNPIMHTFGLTVLVFGSGFLLCKVVDAKPVGLLKIALTPLSKLGYYSYSVYLWHGWACRLLPRHTIAEYLLTFVAAIVPGVVMARLIEMPFLALRDKLFPWLRKSARPTVPDDVREPIPAMPEPAFAGFERSTATVRGLAMDTAVPMQFQLRSDRHI